MPANPITAVTNRRTMQRVVDSTKERHTALFNELLFPASVRENLTEEDAQIDVEVGTLGMAPFVRIGTKAQMVDVLNGTSYTVTTPFINIKRPLTYSLRLAKRMVGGGVFNQSEGIMAAILKAMEKDARTLNTLCDNTEEWMAAMLLRGSIDYSVEGHDSFSIDTGKPAANTYTVSALWNGGSAVPFQDIFDVKEIISEARGPMPNIAICGANAGAAVRDLMEGGDLTAIKTDSGIIAGAGDLRSRIQENGMVFLGRFADIDFFQYLGKFSPFDGGADEYLIRDDYIEYFSTSRAALESRAVMYGVMPDIKAWMDGTAITDRYLISTEPDDDQGTIEGIMKTRPLPWFYRPDWMVSQKVV